MTEATWAFANVEIEPVGSLEETAIVLGKALGGLQFVKDSSGYYEEFPAFTATRETLRFDLLGIPEPENDVREEPRSDDFQLMVRPVRSNEPGENVDISADILGEIAKSGLLACRLLE